MSEPRDDLRALATLWERERAFSRERAAQARRELPLSERIERGVAMDQLSVIEIEAAPGDRTRHWIESQRAQDLSQVRLRAGDPVILWRQSPDEPSAIRAIIDRVTAHKIAVMIDGDSPEALESDGFRLDVDDPEVTFSRGAKALRTWQALRDHEPHGKLRALLFGVTKPAPPAPLKQWTPHDPALHQDQLDGVALALGAEHVALIHGPPGTGKTRTLVEIITQSVERGERVLATAASNMAVDNLVQRLDAAGLRVVRLGHPARVHDDAADLTLDAQLERHEIYKLTRGWVKEANVLFRRLRVAQDRGSMGWEERKQLRREANALMRDARVQTRAAQDAILSRAQVICATATGADSRMLGPLEFDLVVIDEATQSPDPLTLIPMLLAPKVIMAGDPHQLAPTILDPKVEREGLGTTFFERLIKEQPELGVMLTVQHRMHEAIMAYPSESKYEGKLVAHAHVAQHRLEDLGAQPDPLRDGPFIFIDTAGKGWEELRLGDDPSTSNPAQAQRVKDEAIRVASRGVAWSEIAIISPYDAQARLLRQLMAPQRAQGLEIATIDSFQGREKEAVILDLVRCNDRQEIGFLSDTRRMNVALTRAKRQLIVIGDSATISAHPYYEAFLSAAEIYGLWVSAWNDEAEPFDA